MSHEVDVVPSTNILWRSNFNLVLYNLFRGTIVPEWNSSVPPPPPEMTWIRAATLFWTWLGMNSTPYAKWRKNPILHTVVDQTTGSSKTALNEFHGIRICLFVTTRRQVSTFSGFRSIHPREPAFDYCSFVLVKGQIRRKCFIPFSGVRLLFWVCFTSLGYKSFVLYELYVYILYTYTPYW